MSISSWLTDDQLREFLNRYFAGAYHEDDWPAQLQALVERARQEVFNLEALEMLSDEVFVERLVSIYRVIVRVPMYYKAITNHPRRVRTALRYLLESDDDLTAKADTLMTSDGAHYIKGLGKTFWAIFLMALKPDP